MWKGSKVYLDATLLKTNASLDSLEERSKICALKYTPEQYLDQVWDENAQEEDKQGSREESDAGQSNSGSAGFQGKSVKRKPQSAGSQRLL